MMAFATLRILVEARNLKYFIFYFTLPLADHHKINTGRVKWVTGVTIKCLLPTDIGVTVDGAELREAACVLGCPLLAPASPKGRVAQQDASEFLLWMLNKLHDLLLPNTRSNSQLGGF